MYAALLTMFSIIEQHMVIFELNFAPKFRNTLKCERGIRSHGFFKQCFFTIKIEKGQRSDTKIYKQINLFNYYTYIHPLSVYCNTHKRYSSILSKTGSSHTVYKRPRASKSSGLRKYILQVPFTSIRQENNMTC